MVLVFSFGLDRRFGLGHDLDGPLGMSNDVDTILAAFNGKFQVKSGYIRILQSLLGTIMIYVRKLSSSLQASSF